MLTTRQRELLVARICSGSVRLKVNDDTFVVTRPTPEQLYIAQEVYDEYFARATSFELLDDGEIMKHLIALGYWDVSRNSLLESIPKDIDQFKVGLYKAKFKSQEKEHTRKLLKVARDKLGELYEQRGKLDFLSCSNMASLARSKFIIGCSTFRNSQPAFTEDFWGGDSRLLEEVMGAFAEARIAESDFRDLARHEPWRSIWVSHKVEPSVFGCPAIHHTEDQRNLICWSLFYDNIYSHPNCPPEDVINDDDALDGWALVQKKERDAAVNEKHGDDAIGSDKIRNAQEVYIVAETPEDARRIDSLNSENSARIKQQRQTALNRAGELSELDMPDTARRLRMELTKRFAESVK